MSPFRATIGDMNTINKMINSFKIRDPKDIKIIILEPSQRDLVLQGGSALRAEVGVFEVLCKKHLRKMKKTIEKIDYYLILLQELR